MQGTGCANGKMSLLAAACLLVPHWSVALAQTTGEGLNRDLLIQAIEASAESRCPVPLMSNELAEACEADRVTRGTRLHAFGHLQTVQWTGVSQTPLGLAEEYDALFENGRLTWFISADQDGRICMLWSMG